MISPTNENGIIIIKSYKQIIYINPENDKNHDSKMVISSNPRMQLENEGLLPGMTLSVSNSIDSSKMAMQWIGGPLPSLTWGFAQLFAGTFRMKNKN